MAIIKNEMARDAGLASKLHGVESRWQELYDETNGSPLALVHTLGLMRVRSALTFDGALEMLRGNRDAELQQFIFQEARRYLPETTRLRSLHSRFSSPPRHSMHGRKWRTCRATR